MRDNSPRDDDALYDLVPDDPPAKPMAQPPAPVTAPPINYRSAPNTSAKKADAETIKNLYMPMWLLGGGVVVEIVAAMLREQSLQAALLYVGVGVVVGTIVMLAGILIAARIRQIDLGNFWTAVFKLAAIAVAPSAAVSLASPALSRIPFGWLLGLVGQFVLYFALLGALFDLDESDTWYCVCVIFLVRLAVYFGLLVAMAK